MSSKKLVYLLMVSIVCGFIVAGTAHGQSSSTFTIEGTVTNSDETPAAGLAVRGERISLTDVDPVETITRGDGSYKFLFIGLGIPLPGFSPEISVGEQIEITVSDGGTVVHSEVHTVTAAEIEAAFAGTTINITLTDIDVKADPDELYADGTSNSTIKVTVGGGVTEKPTITVDKGTLGDITDEGDGVYTVTYTAPSLAITFPPIDTALISAALTSTGQSASTVIVLLPVPTTVEVDIDRKEFNADTPGTGTVTVTVDRAGPITGESIAFTLNPSVGSGIVSAVTDNGDGTYTATYASGSTAGYVDITAMATPANESGTARISINAGPPAAVKLRANPMRVFSFTSATITAMVTDSNGNGVGGLSLTGEKSGDGELTEFAADSSTFGGYTATYTAPMVDAEMTEMITVTAAAGVSAELTLELTPEPPIEVNILTVGGTVFKADGEVPADGVDVMIMLGSMTKTDTTDEDGSFSEAFIDLSMPVARTGDTVTIVVKDANGVEVGGTEFRLTNDLLDGEPIDVKITTTIVVPPRSVNVLTVTGMVSKEDDTTSAGAGLDVTVMVGSETRTDTTDADGSYSVAFIDLNMPVGTTGDLVSVVVSDASGERGRNDMPLRNIDLPEEGDAADIVRDVRTNIKLTSPILAVSGTVYLKNGDTPVAARSDLRSSELTVVVTNTTRNWSESVSVTNEGRYSAAHLDPNPAAAESGDVITVVVQNEAGQTVSNEPPYTLTTDNIKQPQLSIDVHTSVPAEVRLLHIVGSVIDTNDSPAEPGLGVTITILDMHESIKTETRVLTDADGGYEHVFLALETPIATGDILMIEVVREADQFRGYGIVELSSYQLIYQSQPLVIDPIKLVPPKLELGGLSINPHYTGILDPMLQQFLDMDLAGLAAANPSPADPSGNPLVMLPPSLFLIASPLLSVLGALQLELPMGFDPDDKNIAQESFGNAITTRPTAWAALPAADRDPGRWLNGDHLNLYIVGAPTITDVTFRLNGSSMPATSVPAGGSFTYNFQLEEELIALFVGHMPAFGAVQLMIDGQMPVNMMRSDTGVWSADVALTPGSAVHYYYMIKLARPYRDPMGGLTVSSFPLVDPRNRQVMTGGLLQAFDTLLSSELGAMDPGVRSVFSVPEVNQQQSLWVSTFDFADDPDGEYMLDVNVSYRGGHTDDITGKMFTVDRTAPTADVALDLNAPGMNVGMYMRDDGTYVATGGPMPGEASLTVSAMPNATSEAAAYMYQLARLDAARVPGMWNPAIVAGLLPLNLEKLLNDPTSVLPLTSGDPIEMLIRNSQGGALIGTYGLRAVGIDSLLNMDSSREVGPVVHLVRPDPDVALVTSVQSDFDGNGVIEGLEMQSTAGDVVVFSDSIVELTVYVRNRTDHPLASVAIEFQIPGAGWQPIGMYGADQLVGVMQDDELSVTLPVPDIPVLPDRGGHVMLRTVTTNALNVVNEERFTAAYQRRTAPKVSGIYTAVTDRHPDSGAPQGMITVSAFTQAVTAPNTAAVRLEVRRSADADWMSIGTVPIADTTVTSYVEIAIIEALVNSIISGSPTAPISPLYRKWSLAVDSATLEDTILDDTPAASDASLDVQAVAVDMAGGEYQSSADGITDSISLDNYSPTAITTVAITTVDNEVEMVAAREDGSYYVSGLLAEGVPDPMLTLTSRTGAHSSAFTGGIALVVNDASGTAVEIPATGFSDSGNYTFTGVFNLASIPNGTYTFMAAAHAADGSPEARIVAMAITVEVGNFTPPDNFADPSVDILSVTNTLGEANSPAGTDAMYPTGFPAIDDKVTATLIVPNVSTGDVDVLIGEDGMSAATMGTLMIMKMHDDNNIVIMIDTSGLDEGMYGLVGTVTKPNGSVPFGLPSIRVDRTGPAVEIVSPLSRHQVTTLPTIQVSYTDASGFDPNETNPMPAVISLTRLADSKAIDINTSLIRITAAAAGEILSQSGDIVYAHDDPVVGGAYRIEVSVMDVLGNESTAEPVEFTVEGVQPTVSIVTPIGGQVVDPTQPLIVTAALTGNGEITVTEFQLNGTDTEVTVENNWLTHTVQPPLDNVFERGAGNTVTIKIVDSEGRTAEATSNFVVALDKTPPVVATYSPQGIIRSDRPVAAATVTDESGIDTSSLTIIIAGVPGNQGTGRRSSPTSTTVTFTPSISVTPGPYTARVTVLDVHGNRTEVEWQFTVELDVTPPSITATSPHGIIRSDKPIVSVSASDDRSGVDTIDIVVKGDRGRAVEGIVSTRSDRTAATFTPIVSLENGTYTVDTMVTDKRGNKAAAKWQFTVELDVTPPSITTTSPHGVIRLDRPIISVSASDDHSGVNTIEVMVADKENQLINGITEVHADKTSANFMPSAPLKDGTYTVDVNVTDMRGNQASSKWQFTVELDTIPPSVTITRPAQEHTENRRPIISATYTDDLSGVDGQSIKLWLDDDLVDPDEMSITQVMFTPSSDLEFGQHTVKLEVSDTAPTPNMAVQEWSFFVERIGIANARNYPNPFEDDTTIAFRLSRQASVTVRIYDFTGRLVAEPATNLLEEAGPVEIAWRGDTSAGENLARGVYFCHILMESELEPQSAILKMAIISE